MAIDLHFWPDRGDFAIGVKNKVCPLIAHIGPAIHRFCYTHARLFRYFSVMISTKITFKAMFCAAFGKFLWGVPRRADHFGTSEGKIFDQIGKLY